MKIISNIRTAFVIAAVALAFGGGICTGPVRAADVSTAQFGSVDIQQVLSGYTKKGDFDKQLQALHDQLYGYLQQQSAYPMLSEADQTQLGALLAKPNQTDQDKAQITALEQKSTQAAQELSALQNKTAPTADDNARMTQLLQQQQAGKTALQDMETTYNQQVSAKSDALSAQLSASVKAAITTVAKQRKLAVVFDSQVAIYTANDITDDVLKTLNK